MTDLRQSPEYAQYLKSIGWKTEKIGQGQIFIRNFPPVGSLIKVQRFPSPLPLKEIEKVARKNRAFKIVVEPEAETPDYRQLAAQGYQLLKSPFIPTKTLIIELKKKEEEILASFSKSKRRDVRIAQRNKITIKESNLDDFWILKKNYLKRKWLFPLGAKNDLQKLLQAFGKKACFLIAYHCQQPLAGTLLLNHDQTHYYWQAAATPQGHKLLAPTLVVWEAIKKAKKEGSRIFDFEGIYDPRFPQLKAWKGFTSFKKGFRGKEIIYPKPISRAFWPLELPF
jgi:peptidoglycan pentaglycine glycine transferase (the first glycine)